jgi:hypothetical protein
MKQQNSSFRPRKRARRSSQPISVHPPALEGGQLAQRCTMRFRAIAAASQTAVQFIDLLDTRLVATTATAGFRLFEAVRIERVRVWGIAAIGTSTSVSVEFYDPLGDQKLHTDTSIGVQPAFVDAVPAALSRSAQWNTGDTAAAAFVITCPAGAVIDLHLAFRANLAPFANGAVVNALVGATAGTQYIRGMDGLAVATSNFTPEYSTAAI